MKKTSILIIVLIIIFFPIISGQNSNRIKEPVHCTVFTISKGNQVFFGGNDDYTEADSYYWVDTGGMHYDVLWIGQPDNVQQGVNERHLAYDANGLPRYDVNPHNERPPVEGDYTSYPIHILHECATVDEVINWIKTHRWHSFMHDQMQFADSTGDAVIISAGKDGEVVFTRKQPGDGYLVSTNFNVANPSNGFGYPCERYEKAQEMLGELIKKDGQLTVDDAAGVLDAVHVEKVISWTIESFLADLSNGIVYIYFFYQYDKPVVLNLKDELASPRDPGLLSMLFPDDVRQEAAKRYHQLQDRAKRCRLYSVIWIAIVLASLILFFFISGFKKQGSGFWIPAIIIMGPVAFVLWIIAGRNYKKSDWRLSIIETTGDLMPSVFTFILILLTLISAITFSGNWILQLLAFLVMPVVLAWLLFHGLLLRSISSETYSQFFGRRFPHVLTVSNLSIGGISIVAMPLVNKAISICIILPLSAWTIVVFWFIITIGSLIGGIIIYLYELWAVKRGFQAWNVPAWNEGEMNTPSFRKLWWWVLLSYVVLFAGMAIGVML